MVEIKLFNKWSFSGVEVKNLWLKQVISFHQVITPHSFGRHECRKFGKTSVNVIERLVNHMMRFGPKYAKNTGRMGGKKLKAMKIVETAFDIIHQKTGMNPIQVLVEAIENASPNEDVTKIMYGGVVYYVAVDVSPLRKLDLALRFIADGARETSFNRAISIGEALAEEIILASRNDVSSFAVKKKNELERVALSSR